MPKLGKLVEPSRWWLRSWFLQRINKRRETPSLLLSSLLLVCYLRIIFYLCSCLYTYICVYIYRRVCMRILCIRGRHTCMWGLMVLLGSFASKIGWSSRAKYVSRLLVNFKVLQSLILKARSSVNFIGKSCGYWGEADTLTIV